MDRCPDPMFDWEGYMIWCDTHACRTCEGAGEVIAGLSGQWLRECPFCEGSGVDPAFTAIPDEDA